MATTRRVSLRQLTMAAASLIFLALGTLLPRDGLAETVKVATGEYAPFVGEQLRDAGVTAAIVTAALKTQNVTVAYDFLPWKRGYSEAERGNYAGTYPYLKTPERESEFLYSEPIYADHFRLFVRKSDGKGRTVQELANKSICVPLGYDTTQIQGFTTTNKITVEQPPEIGNCFKMLSAGHVEAVWVSELVGRNTARKLFGRNSQMYPLDTSLVGPTSYYFIISRKLPEAQKSLDRFNAGLKQIHKNGNYKKILTRFAAD